MKHLTEFRNPALAHGLLEAIKTEMPKCEIRIMEVCGGHTATIHKYGIPKLLPTNLKLLSGPGCPVCVTSNEFLDRAIALCQLPDVIVASFGDLLRVPGSRSSLLQEKARGADVRICYSSLDALELARTNPEKKIVFLGIGFETTAPTVAAAIKRADETGGDNFFVLSALKTMPQAMKALLDGGALALDAFICPGHVSLVTGKDIYEFIARDYKAPCVITGFEPLDLLHAILLIVRQLNEGRAVVENGYTRANPGQGNFVARKMLSDVFEPCAVEWRGLGVIPGSGLAIAPRFHHLDALNEFTLAIEQPREHPGCICGAIMRGVRSPLECGLFSKACTPENPKGSCMVSDEGNCATYYKYVRGQSNV